MLLLFCTFSFYGSQKTVIKKVGVGKCWANLWFTNLFLFIMFSYLRMQAKIKVMAGRMLVMATAKVAVVYFMPKKYKFWSITGLQIRR